MLLRIRIGLAQDLIVVELEYELVASWVFWRVVHLGQDQAQVVGDDVILVQIIKLDPAGAQTQLFFQGGLNGELHLVAATCS